MIQEAKDQGPDWPPFTTGLFGRDYTLFLAAADEYAKMAAQLMWL